MVVEIKNKNLGNLQELPAGDCFIYNGTAYMLLENDKYYIKEKKEFPYTAVELETGKINQFTAEADVVKANARVIIE